MKLQSSWDSGPECQTPGENLPGDTANTDFDLGIRHTIIIQPSHSLSSIASYRFNFLFLFFCNSKHCNCIYWEGHGCEGPRGIVYNKFLEMWGSVAAVVQLVQLWEVTLQKKNKKKTR